MISTANIEVITITGYGKGNGYIPGKEMKPNYSWNAVKLKGNYYLLDCTLAAGSVKDS